MPRIPLGVLATLILAVAVALPAARGLAQPTGVHGIDPADMDFGVSPRADFYRFANGGWLDRSTIPPDKGRYGVFDELTDRTTRQLLALLARLGGSNDLAPGTDEWKALQLYEQGTDLAARNVRGLAPIRATLEEIEAIADLAGLHHFVEGATFKQIAGILPVDIQPDLKDSRVYAVYLGGPFLGLPDRDY